MTRLGSGGLLRLLLAASWLAWTPAGAGVRADFLHEVPSPEVRYVADWVLDSHDDAGRPFVVVDKVHFRVFVFDASGALKGSAPALVGLARGDDSVPGIGERAMSAIRPEERTTPAGRFVGSLERSLHGDEILWVDYGTGIALHPVVTSVPAERRLQRLASPEAADHRITYGCINVPAKFFTDVVAPLFRAGGGVVYVLPETRSAHDTFGAYDAVTDAPSSTRAPHTPR